MSMTFFSPQAPRKVVDTYECRCAEDGRPDLECYHCRGKGVVEFHGTENEVSMSNANARELLSHMGLPTEGFGGSVEGEEVHTVLRTITKRLNQDLDDPAIEARETGGQSFVTTDESGNKRIASGPTMYRASRQAGYVTKRLKQLQTLFKEAADNGWAVNWG